MHRNRNTAFTLVELLLVVTIIGILAALAIPKFGQATTDTQTAALLANLKHMRTQIALYEAEHGGDPPDLNSFADQMTRASNIGGQTADIGTAGYPLGPYIHTVPVNPFTKGDTLGAGAVGSSDWYYNQATGEFRANDTAEHRAY